MSAIEGGGEAEENKNNIPQGQPITSNEEQNKQQGDYITIPRDQYMQLSQANRTAVIITAQLVDKFDEILDECAKFESFVRQKKLEAKEMFNAATRPPSTSPQ